jgi:hypothetical protein
VSEEDSNGHYKIIIVFIFILRNLKTKWPRLSQKQYLRGKDPRIIFGLILYVIVYHAS